MVGSAAGILLGPRKEYQRAVQAKSAGNGSSPNIAVTMPLASLKNFGRFHSSFFKGMLVDMPLAVTEGLLAVPTLCGDHHINHAPVVDAKSGFLVAVKVNPLLIPLVSCLAKSTVSPSQRIFPRDSPTL